MTSNPASRAFARERVPLPRHGVLVPIVTPLNADRSPDFDSLTALIGFVADAGVNGVLVLGSSGESVGLSADQRGQVAARAVRSAAPTFHVMVGMPSAGTADAAAEAAAMAAAGADSVLASAPSGLQLSQSELAGHFTTIAAGIGPTPLVAYEVPSRVGVSLSAPLLRQLVDNGTIHGVKDSSGDLPKGRMLAEAMRDRDGVLLFTGAEQCIDAALLGGFHGAIPGLANVFPDFHVELAKRAADGDWAGAARTQAQIVDLLDLYFPSRPLPDASFSAQFFAIAKEALVQLGVIRCGASTAPLTPADAELRDHVAKMLQRAESMRVTARSGVL